MIRICHRETPLPDVMEDNEILSRFKELSSDALAQEENIIEFVLNNEDPWRWSVSECNRRRLKDVYNDLTEVTDKLVSAVLSVNEEDLDSISSLDNNPLRIPDSVRVTHILNDHAIYFKHLWCENQDSLEFERPLEILSTLFEKYQTRAIFSALLTFKNGEVAYLDSPGGIV